MSAKKWLKNPPWLELIIGLMVLLLVEAQLALPLLVAKLVQLGIVALVYGLIALWARADAGSAARGALHLDAAQEASVVAAQFLISDVREPDVNVSSVRPSVGAEPRRRGKLKVFLGYIAGVGKTCAMLEAARQRTEEGVDVVAACVETHGDAETELRLRGLEVVPRRTVPDRGVLLQEMDIDAVLRRQPQLALVDDLAYVNSPAMRHSRRYQDVADLLAAGIDVYTTLDVQYLESLQDAVTQITGLAGGATIPDRVLDEADEIELVDLPPEELLRRFQEGKVCVSEQVGQAARQLYREGNLTALRELAMRQAVRRVDGQLRAYMRAHDIAGPWAAAERLLACISAGPKGRHVVRAACRLADELNAEWTALYVETAKDAGLSEAQRDEIAGALRLAEELGGKVVWLPGTSVAETAVTYARNHNMTKIIVGKSLRLRRHILLRSTVADQLIRRSGSIDVYVIGEPAERRLVSRLAGKRSRLSWPRYALSLGLVALSSLLSALVRPYISPANMVMLYLLGVVVAAIYLGRGPAILASFAGVLAYDFFFVLPSFTLAVADTEYVLTFLGLLGVGLVISNLAAQVHDQIESARQRGIEMAALYALSRDLAVGEGMEAIVRAIVENMDQTFGRQVGVLLPPSEPGKGLRAPLESADFAIDGEEMDVVRWTFQHQRAAGRGTDTFSEAQGSYLPLMTARGVVGVLGVRPLRPGPFLTAGQRRLLEAFASQAALAVERAQLAEAAQHAQLLKATEELQSALLNSISHDLRTPLVSITGVLSSLEDDDAPLDNSTRRELVETAREEAERLNRLVGNLLDMARVEAGAMHIAWELEDIQDIIGSALEQLKGWIEGRQVRVEVPADVPFVPMDFVLVVQVLVNVIDNALKYSAPELPIEIRARAAGGEVEIQVADRGIGIPEEDLDRVFDKFYRVQQRPDNVAGTGLGLSISKGIIEAHGGRIWAENRPGGGTIVTVALPEVHTDG